MTLVEQLAITYWNAAQHVARGGRPDHALAAARVAEKDNWTMSNDPAPRTQHDASPRYIDGAGSHIKKFSPMKRIKALHRKYGAGTSLKAFARLAAVKKLPGWPGLPDGAPGNAAAVAWLDNKKAA